MRVETYSRFRPFRMDNLYISPIHVRVERLRNVIAAHRHSNTSYEIHYCERGHGEVSVNGSRYDVRPGTLYVTGPDLEHAQTCDAADPIVEYCLYLNCHLARVEESAVGSFCETVFWIGQDTGEVFSLLDALVREQRAADVETELISEGLLRQIVGTMIRSYRLHGGSAKQRGVAVLYSYDTKQYPAVEDAFYYNYAALKLEDLAALLNLSQRQTQRFLMAHYGKSFTEKRTEARMAAAAQFLQENDLSVTEIAERTGFSTMEHFSAAFRRYFHMSPREYRRQTKR